MISPRARFLFATLLTAILSSSLHAQNEPSPIVARASIPSYISTVEYDERSARIFLDDEEEDETTEGRQSKLHVLDTNLRTIWTLDRSRIGARPVAFAGFAPVGALYVATAIKEAHGTESSDRGLEIYRFGPTGELEWHRTFDSLGDDIAWVNTVDSRGNLLLLYHRDYYADTTERVVMKISAGGELLWKRIVEINGSSDKPRLFVDRSDRLHIVNMRTRSRRRPWIEYRLFGADGTAGPLRTYPIQNQDARSIDGVCADDSGNVFVTVAIGIDELHKVIVAKFAPGGDEPSIIDVAPPTSDAHSIVPDGRGNLWMFGFDLDDEYRYDARSLRTIGESGVSTIEADSSKILGELRNFFSHTLTLLPTGELQIMAFRRRHVVVARFDSAGRNTLARVTTLLRPDETHRVASAQRVSSSGTIFLIFDIKQEVPARTIATEIVKFRP